MLTLQNVGYQHPNKELLLDNISLTLPKHGKAALIGNNGAGKSTLLKIIAGIVPPACGLVQATAQPYYVPQLYGQYDGRTVAQALGIETKLQALAGILAGDVSEANMDALADDWSLEERFREALAAWQLEGIEPGRAMGSLSGGQKTKVLLASLTFHQPEIILLDEPSNHLDAPGRKLLYNFIQDTAAALMIVSHDRALLDLPRTVIELSRGGITMYGGNYTFYKEQKTIEAAALQDDVRDKEKALRKAREVARETAERKQKLDARGRKKAEKAGAPTIAFNTLRNGAENSAARSKGLHAEKTASISDELNKLRKALPDMDQMKLGFEDAALHRGKILFKASDLNYRYGEAPLWSPPLSFEVLSGERIALKGGNGSGKTTLIRMMLGCLEPVAGTLYRAVQQVVYIDQDYSLIDNMLSVYGQAQHFNASGLQEHELRIRLSRFLFTAGYWNKPCATLSGGERMRLMLCCLTLRSEAPDLIILDEPTNNLDLQNIEILTNAISGYQGTLIAVSHDSHFLQAIGVERSIEPEYA